MQSSTLCLMLLVPWVSTQSSAPPQRECAAALPCMDTCTSGIPCTAAELMTSLPQVEKAYAMKLMEEDAYKFIKGLNNTDFDCMASLINNYCKTGNHAADRESLIALIKAGCPSSTLSAYVDKFYQVQVDKINNIKQKNPQCADVIYTWERSIYKLFNQSQPGQPPNMTAVFQQAMQNCVDIIGEIEKSRDTCETLWTNEYPVICKYYQANHDAMVPMVQGFCRAGLKNPEKTRDNIRKMMEHIMCKPHTSQSTTAPSSA
ncbi:unnamed protein product, partial [Mesorhabditis belari]|uniref:Uncharacterized protein n=1 Tax=Mesorhabditis belari TaxID=2138241 RepID=A0AAF3EBI1_9BILA